MSLFDQVSADIVSAMKAREAVKLEALRGVKKEFIEAKTSKGANADLTDDEAAKIIQKMVKQRRDTAQVYTEQGRPELAEKELQEADFIAVYLPAQLTEAELEAAVRDIIAQTGASSPKEMGKVMGVASKALAGKADGKAVSEMVKKLLNS
ncbi:MAG: GatB/YqeY domain-containing protein [Marinilabiliaceae bacterium]|nr:GatB/YqeY domain-containing protein [Marinilabiliaceae bacterium]